MPESNASESSPSVSNPSVSNAIDWKQALVTAGGDADLLTELLSVYIGEANQMLQRMDCGLRESDRDIIRRSAHTLKGASLSVAAQCTAQQCEKLEEGCQFMDHQQLAGQIAAVRHSANQVTAAIKRRLGNGN